MNSINKSIIKQLIVLVILSVSNSANAQFTSSWSKSLFSDADKAFYIADYLKAMKKYEALLPIDSNNAELNYKIGVCKFEIKRFKKSSKRNFEKVNVKLFPETNYYLGVLNHSQKNYQDAINYFLNYKKAIGILEHEPKEIDDLIEKCYQARFYDTFSDTTIKCENLGANINSEFPDYAPLVPGDDSFLLFTSRRKNSLRQQINAFDEFYEDIYYSKKNGTIWETPAPLDTAINTAVHDACTALSLNGKQLLFFRTSKDLLSGDIYESNYLNGTWQHPQPLGEHVNTYDNIESSACYAPNGNNIIFSSNKLKGFGGLDLYMVNKLTDTTWSQPINLGATINTEYNEDAPFIDATSTYLYFSSEGHKNMGGYDVFKSIFNEDGKFTIPQNMGVPINSVNDDIFFVLNADDSHGYVSSEREDGYGEQDIYGITFMANTEKRFPFTIKVFNTEHVSIKNCEIELQNLANKNAQDINVKANNLTGITPLYVQKNIPYRVSVKANGYQTLVLDNYTFDKEFVVEFTLKK